MAMCFSSQALLAAMPWRAGAGLHRAILPYQRFASFMSPNLRIAANEAKDFSVTREIRRSPGRRGLAALGLLATVCLAGPALAADDKPAASAEPPASVETPPTLTVTSRPLDIPR